ncbi:MAG: KilA-N domain-containing protein [Saprospiraceae bacterium]
MAKRKIKALDFEIRLSDKDGEDFICVTDIAKFNSSEPGQVVRNYFRNKGNIDFLGAWEKLHNENFNYVEFDVIRAEVGSASFTMSAKEWAERTGAVGITATAGRFGGTFAHSDIAMQFTTWLSPEFYLYVLKDYQRLKEEEQKSIEWNIRRLISKANFRIHTEAVRQNIVPLMDWNTGREAMHQASEADVLNLALFGMTARQFKEINPKAKGNLRDNATALQLLVLASLEVSNAELIEQGLPKPERIMRLNKKAQERMLLLVDSASGQELVKHLEPTTAVKQLGVNQDEE